MAIAAPEMIASAERLLARERAAGGAAGAPLVAAARACEELVACLAHIVGEAGARALFDRSVALSRRDHPWLPETLAPPGAPPWAALRASLEANEPRAAEASIAILTTLVSVFENFVGSSLALRILHKHAPDAFPIDAPEETE